MTEFYVLVQEQLTVISTMLIIGLAALFCAELKSNFQQLWKNRKRYRGESCIDAIFPPSAPSR